MKRALLALGLALAVGRGGAEFKKIPSYEAPVEVVPTASDEAKAAVAEAFAYANAYFFGAQPRALVQVLDVARQSGGGIDLHVRLVLGTSTCPDRSAFCGMGHVTDVAVVYMFRTANNNTAPGEPKYRLLQLPHQACQSRPTPAVPIAPPPVGAKSAPASAAPGFHAVFAQNRQLAGLLGRGPPGAR